MAIADARIAIADHRSVHFDSVACRVAIDPYTKQLSQAEKSNKSMVNLAFLRNHPELRGFPSKYGWRSGMASVLIVEDEALLALAASEALRDNGLEVIEAAHAMEALDILEERDIDLLFTDINMPGKMNGLELARIAHEAYPAMEIVLTSGEVEPGLEDHLIAAFVSKPYNLDGVAKFIVKRATASHKRTRRSEANIPRHQ
jgi:CheY-like chemotaxis protein